MVDLTVWSNILPYDSIGRHGIGIISAVQNDRDVNLSLIGTANYRDIPARVMKDLVKPFTAYGKVGIWTYILGLNEGMIPTHQKVRKAHEKTIALSMFESDDIPKFWVNILNEYYDEVIVPDAWLVPVYQKAGVTKPIHVIPLGCFLEPFLTSPAKKEANSVFTFGLSAGAWQRKNMIKLIEAFALRFKNVPRIQLKLHSRFGPYFEQIQKAVTQSKADNISLSYSPMSDKDYLGFMRSLDCVVIPSQGEGYGIPAREAIALGTPAIVSNNTAHKTICDTGLVTSLKSNNQVPAIYEVFQNQQIGNYFDCTVSDLADAMTDVYENYQPLLDKAQSNREFSKQFLWSSLKDQYLKIL